jgi:hypothetical protein
VHAAVMPMGNCATAPGSRGGREGRGRRQGRGREDDG